MMTLIQLVTKYKLVLLGAFLGAMGGFCYYSFIGCASGKCAITSNPINSTLYGTMMGALFFSMFKKDSKIID